MKASTGTYNVVGKGGRLRNSRPPNQQLILIHDSLTGSLRSCSTQYALEEGAGYVQNRAHSWIGRTCKRKQPTRAESWGREAQKYSDVTGVGMDVMQLRNLALQEKTKWC